MSKLVHPDNKFVDLVMMGVMYIALCFIIPIFFVVKLLSSLIKRILFLYEEEENMQGKVVIITGASSGIGEHLAYEYAKRKASLVFVARREGRLHDVAEAARRLGAPDVLPLCADVSDPEACKKFVDQTIQHFGRLDHLVNNAGIVDHCLFEDLIDVKLQPMMRLLRRDSCRDTHCSSVTRAVGPTATDINFWGSIYPTHYAIPHLKKSKGKIIVNSSSAAVMSPPKLTFYNSSKAAIISFYETLRAEVSPFVSITIVTLGYVDSDFTNCKQTQEENDVMKMLPIMSTEPCAKAIVEGVCRGKGYVTLPQFYRAFHLGKYFCPEIVEWYYSKVSVKKPKLH